MPDRQPKHILVVDDEALLREILVDEFEGYGARVSAAADGAEALELCRRTDFDAIVSDIRMPKMDGLAFLRQLRNETTCGAKVFVCSGFNDAEEELSRLDVVDVFPKPFDIVALANRVIDALGEAKPRNDPVD